MLVIEFLKSHLGCNSAATPNHFRELVTVDEQCKEEQGDEIKHCAYDLVPVCGVSDLGLCR
jgi:hypothetical protein